MLNELKMELKTLTWPKCRELMMNLGIEKHKLDNIEHDYDGTERKKEEAFDLWLKTKPDVKWDYIIHGLQEIDENVLAKSISLKKDHWKDPRVILMTFAWFGISTIAIYFCSGTVSKTIYPNS